MGRLGSLASAAPACSGLATGAAGLLLVVLPMVDFDVLREGESDVDEVVDIARGLAWFCEAWAACACFSGLAYGFWRAALARARAWANGDWVPGDACGRAVGSAMERRAWAAMNEGGGKLLKSGIAYRA